MTWFIAGHHLSNADQLLRCYVDTDDNAPAMQQLRAARDELLSDVDNISTPAELNGLIHWLLRDHAVNFEGESLEETAERLGDLDIEADEDQYTDLIFTLKIAIERLDEFMLDTL